VREVGQTSLPRNYFLLKEFVGMPAEQDNGRGMELQAPTAGSVAIAVAKAVGPTSPKKVRIDLWKKHAGVFRFLFLLPFSFAGCDASEATKAGRSKNTKSRRFLPWHSGESFEISFVNAIATFSALRALVLVLYVVL
jgi:hypothetical protein